jgi:phage shock protein A
MQRPSARGAVVVEANLFSRLARVVKSYISNFTAQFEDPEVLLDRVTEEMQSDLIRMRQAVAKVTASERQMAAKYKTQQEAADEWLRRAELAVRKGQDDLAREALTRRKSYESAAASLKTQLDMQNKALTQLTANMRMLEGKLQEAGNKRESLKARAATAKSSKAIQEMVGGLRSSTSTAWAAFDKMEEKVMAMEAEADQAGLLATPDQLEARFLQMEGGVEDELAALKAGALKASAAKQPAQLVSGRRMADVLVFAGAGEAVYSGVDAELDELRRRARQ